MNLFILLYKAVLKECILITCLLKQVKIWFRDSKLLMGRGMEYIQYILEKGQHLI